MNRKKICNISKKELTILKFILACSPRNLEDREEGNTYTAIFDVIQQDTEKYKELLAKLET